MSGYADGQLLVNVARLRETSGHIQSAVSAMRTQLADLESDARPLVATWSGAAREAYQERQNIWRQASDDIVSLLNQIRVALDESASDYENTEAANANLFR
ncbi:MAG: WXG100 family type VII secretion target [Betaproteobacteria bacterium]